jgi:hypothetical protein
MSKTKNNYSKKLELKLIERIETTYFHLKPLFRYNEEYLSLKEQFKKDKLSFKKFLEDIDEVFCSIPKTQIKKQEETKTTIERLDIKSNYNSK